MTLRLTVDIIFCLMICGLFYLFDKLRRMIKDLRMENYRQEKEIESCFDNSARVSISMTKLDNKIDLVTMSFQSMEDVNSDIALLKERTDYNLSHIEQLETNFEDMENRVADKIMDKFDKGLDNMLMYDPVNGGGK